MSKLLSNILKRSRDKKKVILFLGAGASIESGCETTETIVNKFLKNNLECYYNLNDINKYNKFYEILDSLGRGDRYALLSEYFENMEPSIGYIKLADLLIKRYFNIIITTNFDNMLEKSLTQIGLTPNKDYSIFIIGLHKDSEFKYFLKSNELRIKIIKLHGDLSTGIMRFTPEETFDFPQEIKELLFELTENTILFVGYSGRDRDVLQILNHEGESVWWASLMGLDFEIQENRKILKFLLNRNSDKNIITNSHARFDNLFISLHNDLIKV